MPLIDTITAVASGWGRGHWALIRISGPTVPGVTDALLSFQSAPGAIPPWSIRRAEFRLTDQLNLPCLAMRFDPPRTFTGEPMAELLVPGNPHVVERVLSRLTTQPGVREAEPGEFSARAYLNGKMTLAQAEGLAASIFAQTESELVGAEQLRSGEIGVRHRDWCNELATLLALVEAGIDFTDQEDVVPIAPGILADRVDGLRTRLAAYIGRQAGTEQARLVPKVALVGPPNAGKSTLFNALLGRRRAVESPIAGTTRDVLIEPLTLDRGQRVVELMDLPGLDAALAGRSRLDHDSQVRAQAALDGADVLIECRPKRMGEIGSPSTAPRLPDKPTIRVRTMSDLPGSLDDGLAGSISVCAVDGWNLDVVRGAIADAAFHPTSPRSSDSGAPSFVLPRHRRATARALEHLSAAFELIDPSAHSLATSETVANELRLGLDALAELTGQISPDDIIGRIFATFCIGK